VNVLVLVPFALVIVPFLPALVEIFRRKDRGPRAFPGQTVREEGMDIQVPGLERVRSELRTKEPGEVIRVIGNISMPDGTEMANHLVVQGDLRLGKKCHLHGSIKAFGNVEVGERSVVEGNVLSEGKIHVGRDSMVRGVVDSPHDITLEQNATVEAVSTEKTVKLKPGAKINRRILSGASVIALPEEARISKVETMRVGEEHPTVRAGRTPPAQPVKQEPSLVRAEPPSSKKVSMINGAESSRPEKPQETPERITDQIFRYLEDRIRRLNETPRKGLGDMRFEGLSPKEVKVLTLAYMGSSLEEMCLRLLADPQEVQEILKSLIQKGYLDKDLRPKGPQSREGRPAEAPGKAQGLRTEQLAPTEVKVKEKKLAPQDELLERLIASKMREELKRKLERKPKATQKYDDATSTAETTKTFSAGLREAKRIMEEWKRTSSLLWETYGGEESHTSTGPDSASRGKRNRASSLKGSRAKGSEGNIRRRLRRQDSIG